MLLMIEISLESALAHLDSIEFLSDLLDALHIKGPALV